jgi:F-type H+-transporting ATPase subunit c
MAEIETLGLALGAGLAAIGVSGPALAVGNVAAKMLEGAARQPEHTGALFTNAIIFAGMSEALGILAWLVSFLLFGKITVGA